LDLLIEKVLLDVVQGSPVLYKTTRSGETPWNVSEKLKPSIPNASHALEPRVSGINYLAAIQMLSSHDLIPDPAILASSSLKAGIRSYTPAPGFGEG
jgi:hypothetical protein